MKIIPTSQTTALYRAPWMTEYQPVSVQAEVKPSGRIGRFFGATNRIFVVVTSDDHRPFSVPADHLAF